MKIIQNKCYRRIAIYPSDEVIATAVRIITLGVYDTCFSCKLWRTCVGYPLGGKLEAPNEDKL